MHKTIYVVGGTNGVGKSTIREELLGSSIPYINADFIAKELKTQHASLMLAELAGKGLTIQFSNHFLIDLKQLSNIVGW